MKDPTSLAEVIRRRILVEVERTSLEMSRSDIDTLTDCIAVGVLGALRDDRSADAVEPAPRAGASTVVDRAADAANGRLLAEEQRARLNAERLNRLKDEFLATVSHELRTPLQAMMGWARLLKSGDLDAAGTQKGLEAIERNAHFQAHLVEDILDVSAIVRGRLRLRADPIDLPTILDAALETVRHAALAKGVTLTAVYEPGVGTMVGDVERLQQIVWNLLANAVKFTGRGGHVGLAARRTAACIEITVDDDGKGIGADFLPFVFDRFRQAEGGSSRSHGGLGLGLAIVRHFTEAHGGSVSASSAGAGKGSRFRVELPIGAIPVAQTSVPRRALGEIPTAPLRRALDGLRLLVVDDEDDARELLGIMLEKYGATVRAAASSQEALGALDEATFDVIISDIGMAGEDGHAFMRKVRSHVGQSGQAKTFTSTIPALALTAYARAEDQRKALAAGFQMHLAKPVEPATLIDSIARLAGRGADPVTP